MSAFSSGSGRAVRLAVHLPESSFTVQVPEASSPFTVPLSVTLPPPTFAVNSRAPDPLSYVPEPSPSPMTEDTVPVNLPSALNLNFSVNTSPPGGSSPPEASASHVPETPSSGASGLSPSSFFSSFFESSFLGSSFFRTSSSLLESQGLLTSLRSGAISSTALSSYTNVASRSE